MSFSDYKSKTVNPKVWNRDVSIITSQSGRVTDADFDGLLFNNDPSDGSQCYATILSFGDINDPEEPEAVTASIVYEFPDGNIGFLEGARPGIQYVVGKCRRILSSGDDRHGNTITTTAQNINWQGGEY